MNAKRWRLNKMCKPKITQTKVIKNHLLSGKSITTWEAIQLYHITCLATRISELRRLGLQIKQERINSNDTHWQVYWLDSSYIQSYLANGGHNE
tara:strand:+ start:93 stop:374 length:282 start_codon:yes stop_codon:yes gene_type:complete